MKIIHLLHTVRYLRLPQLIGQLRRRFYFPPFSPIVRHRCPGTKSALPELLAALPPAPNRQPPERLRKGEFAFLNQYRQLGWPPHWDPPGCSKLWLYNLHYFQWLEDLDYTECRAVVGDWIDRYPPSRRADGWEPYPVSVRLINWLRIFWGRYSAQLRKDADFRVRLEESVCRQARWLNRRLETWLLGNHYLENAVALTMAGNLVRGREAESWYRRGLKILRQEIAEQILSDGLHFELSPMYHLRVTWLMLLLAAGGGGEAAFPPAGLLERMLAALDLLTHPDGEIALFNDSAFVIYPPPEVLSRAAEEIIGRRLPRCGNFTGGWQLPSAGYFGYRDREGNCLVCDAGRVGPDYIPGHGHGDIFSFELSLRGRRVVVDSGVCGYELGAVRDYDRSTRAHNTVEVEGADQAEFWGVFRVARRGRPRDVECRQTPEDFFLQGWHDGYRRLAGSPVHHRRFRRLPSGAIAIEDRIKSSRAVRAVSRVHLHPDCRIEEQGESRVVVSHPGGRFLIAFSGEGELAIEKSFYSPRFGERLENIALAFSAFGANIQFGFRIIPMVRLNNSTDYRERLPGELGGD